MESWICFAFRTEKLKKIFVILFMAHLQLFLVGYSQSPVSPSPPPPCEEQENCEPDPSPSPDPNCDDEEGGGGGDGGSDGANLLGFGGFGLTSSVTEGESNVRTIEEFQELIARTDEFAAPTFSEESYDRSRKVKIPWGLREMTMKALGSDGLLYSFEIVKSKDNTLKYNVIAKDLDTGEVIRNEIHTVYRGNAPVKSKAVYHGLRLARTSRGFNLTGGDDGGNGDDDDGGNNDDGADCPCDGTTEQIVHDDWTGCPRKVVLACDADPYDAPKHKCFDSELRVRYLGAFHSATAHPVSNSAGETIGHKIEIHADTISKDPEDNDTWHPEFEISFNGDLEAEAIPTGGCCWIGGVSTEPYFNGLKGFAQSNGIFDLTSAGRTHFKAKLKSALDNIPSDQDPCVPNDIMSLPVSAAILGNWGCPEVQDSYNAVKAEDSSRPENNKYIGLCRPIDEEDTNPQPQLISFPRGALPDSYKDLCGCKQDACPPGTTCDTSTCNNTCGP